MARRSFTVPGLEKITPAGTLMTIYSFCALANCADGGGPSGLALGAAGNFYGTTSGGGSFSLGTVLRITAQGALTTIYSFCPQGGSRADGYDPLATVIQATDGNLYGTTQFGGLGGGTVFKLTPRAP